MKDQQWDELVEMFEVVKYGQGKEDNNRRPEKDLQRSNGKGRT